MKWTDFDFPIAPSPGQLAEFDYRDRYVAFLDMLGFSQLIATSKSSSERAFIHSMTLQMKAFAEIKNNSDLRAKHFSDSLVISTEVTADGLADIFNAVELIFNYLLRWGVLVRGGIVRGEHYQTDDVAFGPAMIAAYKLDKPGTPPRILLSENVVLDATLSNDADVSSMVITDAYDRSEILHIFSEYGKYEYDGFNGKLLEKYSKGPAGRIYSNCHVYTHPREVLAKWLWLENYWNTSVSRYGVLWTTDRMAQFFTSQPIGS